MRSKKSTRAKKPARGKIFANVNPSSLMKSVTRLSPRWQAIVAATVVVGIIAPVMVIARRSAEAEAERATLIAQRSASMGSAADAEMTGANGSSASTTTAAAKKAAPITVTGCLERTDDVFRLKDTAGTDAPKSRSWKSAFLKKGPAAIEVIDASHRLRLQDHAGERVSVTGTLVGREMQARSLQRVAASCDQNGGRYKAD